ncbi:MAG: alpha/beta hydrolase [Archangium sp.]
MRFGCLVLVLFLGCAPEEVTGRTEEFDLPSEKVGDTFRIFVRVPLSYDVDQTLHFPAVVQLDANLPFLDEYLSTVNQAVQLEAAGTTVPVIVVGVGYPNAAEAERKRLRDFSLPMESEAFRAQWASQVPVTGAPQFYEFVRDELMPELNRRYRLNGPARTALFGHSMGGLFSVYAASRHDEAPLFSAYLAASPALFWDDGQMVTRFHELPDFASPVKLMVTDGSLEGPETAGYVRHFSRQLEERARTQLELKTARFEVGHIGTTTPSFREALRFVFPVVTE